jgi:hypothetical protein
MERLTLVNGNGKEYIIDVPKIVLQDTPNDTWLKLVSVEDNLEFTKTGWGFEAQPTTNEQIVKFLIRCGGAKVRYYNNLSQGNAIYVRFDHHVGFDVTSICLDCVKHNNIHVGDLKLGDRLSC